ncbi:MAG: glycosyltransferase family 4 protein [Candidatus Zambryskibacteria bacterium]|nr:glycosyltransferase family 4 protein [Candidatus Zambryskibacteria bacterium]
MRLLILTQKVDRDDPILGFFHRWIEEFAKRFDKITVICLQEGEHNLPGVKVLSLGKEKSQAKSYKLKALLNFYKFIWQERKNYDAVFVHMNQEYVLLGWKFWKLWGKKIFLWRNHAKGNFLTRLAIILSDKVFCTSPSSYTARFKKTILMPVGIDTDFFKPDPTVTKKPNSVLFLGRISPVKKVLEFVEWFNRLDEKFHAIIAGPTLPKDKDYEKLVRSRASDSISFIGPVTQSEALKLYQSHEIYANFTPSGSMDKTIFEAAACGMKLEVRNPDIQNFRIEDHSLQLLMEKIKMEIS